MLTAVWMLLLLGLGAAALVMVTTWRYRIEMAELGTVSQQWLSEHRAHDRHYSER